MENHWKTAALAIEMAALFGSASATESSFGTSQTGRFAILDTFRQEAFWI